eukprot:UN33542
MQHHIRSATAYGVPVVVCINSFPTDTDNEIKAVQEAALEAGAHDAVPSKSFEHGGQGATDLADSVKGACNKPKNFKFLYEKEMSLQKKIETIAGTYNAKKVTFSEEALSKLKQYTDMGYGEMPICMAKTPLSLSTDPDMKGAPKDFDIHIRDVRLSAGAGFVVAYLGNIMTMPG